MADRTVVVGYGSIGARHARVLSQLGYAPVIVSRREIEAHRHYRTLAEALERETPAYVVIANRTSEHYATFKELAEAGYQRRVLVEKPLFDTLYALPRHRFAAAFVGYNLRFHPVVQRLRALLQGEKVLSAQIYVGQYLPEWRPAIDYRESYSAQRHQGGGVLRDLSHELDYANWLFGGWTALTALGGTFGDLEIDTDDVFAILMQTRNCPVVALQMNYLDRVLRREILVNTAAHSFKADLISGTVQVDRCPPESYPVDRDSSFMSLHRAALDGPNDSLATLQDGLDVLRMIAAAERAVDERAWITAADMATAPPAQGISSSVS